MSRDRYPELFDLADPTATQTALTVSHDKTIEDIRKEVIKIVTISGHSGTLDDPVLWIIPLYFISGICISLTLETENNFESAQIVQLTKLFKCKETMA